MLVHYLQNLVYVNLLFFIHLVNICIKLKHTLHVDNWWLDGPFPTSFVEWLQTRSYVKLFLEFGLLRYRLLSLPCHLELIIHLIVDVIHIGDVVVSDS